MAETKTKYNSKKIELDGHVFDSKAEARYYEELKLQQEQSKILFFRLQPRYELQESFKKSGKLHRKIEYVADFEIHYLDGSIETIDVKDSKQQTLQLNENYSKRSFLTNLHYWHSRKLMEDGLN